MIIIVEVKKQNIKTTILPNMVVLLLFQFFDILKIKININISIYTLTKLSKLYNDKVNRVKNKYITLYILKN